MIIEVPAKTGDVISLKLIGGEEVIGRLVEQTNLLITLAKPRTFMMGAQGLGLVPYVFSAPDDVKVGIQTFAVVVQTKTDANVAKQYTQQTSNLIV